MCTFSVVWRVCLLLFVARTLAQDARFRAPESGDQRQRRKPKWSHFFVMREPRSQNDNQAEGFFYQVGSGPTVVNRLQAPPSTFQQSQAGTERYSPLLHSPYPNRPRTPQQFGSRMLPGFGGRMPDQKYPPVLDGSPRFGNEAERNLSPEIVPGRSPDLPEIENSPLMVDPKSPKNAADPEHPKLSSHATLLQPGTHNHKAFAARDLQSSVEGQDQNSEAPLPEKVIPDMFGERRPRPSHVTSIVPLGGRQADQLPGSIAPNEDQISSGRNGGGNDWSSIAVHIPPQTGNIPLVLVPDLPERGDLGLRPSIHLTPIIPSTETQAGQLSGSTTLDGSTSEDHEGEKRRQSVALQLPKLTRNPPYTQILPEKQSSGLTPTSHLTPIILSDQFSGSDLPDPSIASGEDFEGEKVRQSIAFQIPRLLENDPSVVDQSSPVRESSGLRPPSHLIPIEPSANILPGGFLDTGSPDTKERAEETTPDNEKPRPSIALNLNTNTRNTQVLKKDSFGLRLVSSDKEKSFAGSSAARLDVVDLLKNVKSSETGISREPGKVDIPKASVSRSEVFLQPPYPDVESSLRGEPENRGFGLKETRNDRFSEEVLPKLQEKERLAEIRKPLENGSWQSQPRFKSPVQDGTPEILFEDPRAQYSIPNGNKREREFVNHGFSGTEPYQSHYGHVQPQKYNYLPVLNPHLQTNNGYTPPNSVNFNTNIHVHAGSPVPSSGDHQRETQKQISHSHSVHPYTHRRPELHSASQEGDQTSGNERIPSGQIYFFRPASEEIPLVIAQHPNGPYRQDNRLNEKENIRKFRPSHLTALFPLANINGQGIHSNIYANDRNKNIDQLQNQPEEHVLPSVSPGRDTESHSIRLIIPQQQVRFPETGREVHPPISIPPNRFQTHQVNLPNSHGYVQTQVQLPPLNFRFRLTPVKEEPNGSFVANEDITTILQPGPASDANLRPIPYQYEFPLQPVTIRGTHQLLFPNLQIPKLSTDAGGNKSVSTTNELEGQPKSLAEPSDLRSPERETTVKEGKETGRDENLESLAEPGSPEKKTTVRKEQETGRNENLPINAVSNEEVGTKVTTTTTESSNIQLFSRVAYADESTDISTKDDLNPELTTSSLFSTTQRNSRIFSVITFTEPPKTDDGTGKDEKSEEQPVKPTTKAPTDTPFTSSSTTRVTELVTQGNDIIHTTGREDSDVEVLTSVPPGNDDIGDSFITDTDISSSPELESTIPAGTESEIPSSIEHFPTSVRSTATTTTAPSTDGSKVTLMEVKTEVATEPAERSSATERSTFSATEGSISSSSSATEEPISSSSSTTEESISFASSATEELISSSSLATGESISSATEESISSANEESITFSSSATEESIISSSSATEESITPSSSATKESISSAAEESTSSATEMSSLSSEDAATNLKADISFSSADSTTTTLPIEVTSTMATSPTSTVIETNRLATTKTSETDAIENFTSEQGNGKTDLSTSSDDLVDHSNADIITMRTLDVDSITEEEDPVDSSSAAVTSTTKIVSGREIDQLFTVSRTESSVTSIPEELTTVRRSDGKLNGFDRLTVFTFTEAPFGRRKSTTTKSEVPESTTEGKPEVPGSTTEGKSKVPGSTTEEKPEVLGSTTEEKLEVPESTTEGKSEMSSPGTSREDIGSNATVEGDKTSPTSTRETEISVNDIVTTADTLEDENASGQGTKIFRDPSNTNALSKDLPKTSDRATFSFVEKTSSRSKEETITFPVGDDTPNITMSDNDTEEATEASQKTSATKSESKSNFLDDTIESVDNSSKEVKEPTLILIDGEQTNNGVDKSANRTRARTSDSGISVGESGSDNEPENGNTSLISNELQSAFNNESSNPAYGGEALNISDSSTVQNTTADLKENEVTNLLEDGKRNDVRDGLESSQENTMTMNNEAFQLLLNNLVTPKNISIGAPLTSTSISISVGASPMSPESENISINKKDVESNDASISPEERQVGEGNQPEADSGFNFFSRVFEKSISPSEEEKNSTAEARPDRDDTMDDDAQTEKAETTSTSDNSSVNLAVIDNVEGSRAQDSPDFTEISKQQAR